MGVKSRASAASISEWWSSVQLWPLNAASRFEARMARAAIPPKAARSSRTAPPFPASRKAATIRRVTQAWLATHHVPWVEIRFDVVAVLMEPGRPATLRHYEAAF